MKDSTTRTVRKLCLITAGLVLAAQAGAVVQNQQSSDLHSLAFESSRLTVAPENAALDEARASVGLDADLAFQSFAATSGGQWVGYVDRRTGQIGYFEGSGLAWIPGRGNALELDSLATVPGLSPAVDLALLDSKARDFARTAAPMLGLDPAGLRLNPGRSGSPSAHVWFVDYDYLMNGVPVEGARVVFSINNGNLVAVGSENLPMPGSRMPRVAVSANLAPQDGRGLGRRPARRRDLGRRRLLPPAARQPRRPALRRRLRAGSRPRRRRRLAVHLPPARRSRHLPRPRRRRER